MKRFVLSLFVVLIALSAPAFVTNSATNVSQSAGPPRAVQEPTMYLQQVSGVTHGIVAYMNIPNTSVPGNTQIQIAHSSDLATWQAPVTLSLAATNGVTYERSGDPVLVEGNTSPNQGWLYCIGTLSGSAGSTIGAWHSLDGGATWSQPDVLTSPPSTDTDDKPEAAVHQNGTIYVAFERFHPALNGQPATTSVYVAEMVPGRGTSVIGPIVQSADLVLPGPTPAIDRFNGNVFLFYIDRAALLIRTYVSSDGIYWSPSATVSAPGIAMSTLNVGSTTLYANPFLAVKTDGWRTAYVAFHHDGGTSGIPVALSVFSLASQTWVRQPATVYANNHLQWNPAILPTAGGDVYVTYYDYQQGVPGRINPDPGYTLYASHVDAYGNTVETSPIHQVNPATQQIVEYSDPAGYNVSGYARIGEYQELVALGAQFFAVTIYIPKSTPQVGNAYVVKFTLSPR